MKKLNKIAAALAVAGLGVAGTAMAQTSDYSSAGMTYYNPSWYITPSLDLFDPSGKFGVHNDGPGAGLRVGKSLAPNWDIQMGLTYARAVDGDARYNQDTLGVDGLYYFSRDRFRPFLLAGIGAEYDKATDDGARYSRTSPYLEAGLGAQYQLSDQWAVQADLRDVHGFLYNSGFTNHVDNKYFTVGLTYYFDKPAPPPMPAMAVPPPAPVMTPPPPPPQPRFEHYTLSSTDLFAFNSSVLAPNQGKLDQIADALLKDPSINDVVITGYTDRIGSDKYNLTLSQKRADSVKTYLVSKGVGGSRLSTVGKGKADPVVQCDNKNRAELIKCLEPNRRVEIEQVTVTRRVQ